jgi:hypothetical protein
MPSVNRLPCPKTQNSGPFRISARNNLALGIMPLIPTSGLSSHICNEIAAALLDTSRISLPSLCLLGDLLGAHGRAVQRS